MKVQQLFIKSKREKQLEITQSIILEAGQGIKSDIHALLGSPRQILLVSRKTLIDFDLEPGYLGENLLIDGEIEQFKSGQVLKIGEDSLIRLTFHCEPCQYLEKIRQGLKKSIKTKRGFLAMVVKGGLVKENDNVTLTDYQFPYLSDEVKGRFWEFIARIPRGKVVNTSDLLVALGVSRAYYRAIPTFLKKADTSLPIHRLVNVEGRLLDKFIPDQSELLSREGVQLDNNSIIDKSYFWESSHFHDLKLTSNLSC